MSSSRIAPRYAKSLLDLAQERGNLKEVYDDIRGLSKSISGSKELFNLLKNPIVKSDKKQSILKAIFSGKVQTLTDEFIQIVARKGRENHIPEICDAFVSQYNKLHKITKAKLVSASAIDEELINKVKAIVTKNTGAASVELETSVDEKLIGGFVLRFDDKLLDNSVAHKLEKLKKEFS